MFQQIREYDLLRARDQWYRPRAYVARQKNGVWEGWLVFFPTTGAEAIAAPCEIVQRSRTAVMDWAAGLSSTYVKAALDRALHNHERPLPKPGLGPDDSGVESDVNTADAGHLVKQARTAVDRTDAGELDDRRIATQDAITATDWQPPPREKP